MPLPFDALLLDVGHTLLQTAEPVAQTYTRIAAEHGLERRTSQVRGAFREAFEHARPPRGGMRYVGDGRPFWRRVVAASLGSEDPRLFEALYGYFAQPQAWRVAEGALPLLERARLAGLRVALVSDWDTRLRPLLSSLGLLALVDHAAISCELGVEKPDPQIFLFACDALLVSPERAVHVGDDPRRDAAGARLAGCSAWTWRQDVRSFDELAARLGL